ncbi:hypothetical protein EDB89DRAFT_2242879 [Lactarius sanguifluus]|nr:hypothetical protein EDB89DRAFT_2242879 [Lactarius sanguifluus]
MLSVNESPSFLPTVPRPVPRPPPPVKPDLPTVQRHAPPSHVASTHNRRAQHVERRGICIGTAVQEELAAQRGAFSGALALDEGVPRAAEKMGANLDVMKREREQLRDHRGKALGRRVWRYQASSSSRLRF